MSRFDDLRRMAALIWSAARGWTLAWLGLMLVQGLLPVATVYLTRSGVDGLAHARSAGASWPEVRSLILVGALLASTLLLAEVLRGLTGFVRAAQLERFNDHVADLIHRQSLAADMAFYEWPEYYDQLHRARADAGHRPVALLESLSGLLQNGVTLLAMAAVLIPYGIWLPVLLVLSSLPALLVVLRFTLERFRWRSRFTAEERKAHYYDWVLTSGEAAAEVRLFGLGEHFRTLYREVRHRHRDERLRMSGRQAIAELQAGAVAVLATGGAMAWMVGETLRGRATLGDLALFYQSFQLGQRLMGTLLQNVGQIYANSLFLGDLFKFLSLRPGVCDPLEPRIPPFPAESAPAGEIRFEGVGFGYTEGSRRALNNFDLEVPAGQLVALVGPNGAGKSTLIKLLCRFYDPQAGRITIDGVDLRDLSQEELRGRISVLFQEPVRFSATVAESIGMGDLRRGGEPEIRRAAEAAGATDLIGRLPGGFNQLLGHWFASGTELSGGEWQRIALARAFLRRSPIIALDEPTSALDPWAEADWLARFRSLAAGRTALFITHRFTAAMHADVIHVMSCGRVVESGNHQELLAVGGHYAQSWTAQTRKVSID